eukprot:CAMPEP_0181024110 /NCGR_PEP_ID=MMETSP1070-20121207/2397_1 /TAXON_ID=265543 /ORGANISM="Minutocellus polymorphus, Strain NH13" /LENGTH=424 /DNA_ID=CAMNT_0023101145 /DNA_START=174 /DNA_END=1448 /DNA_ORIENTATION=+
MKFLKRPRPGAHNGGVELATNGFDRNAGDAGRQEPFVGEKSATGPPAPFAAAGIKAVPNHQQQQPQGQQQQQQQQQHSTHDSYYQMTSPRRSAERIPNPQSSGSPADADGILPAASSASMPPLRVPSVPMPNPLGMTPAELYYNRTSSSKRPNPNGGGGGVGVCGAAVTFTDEEDGLLEIDDDDDEYSRYSSNYLADHNRNRHVRIVAPPNETANDNNDDDYYPPPSPGGRRSAPYDLNRSRSDYTAPFDDTEEWTPDDSAYGAACPVFGWIPKPIRKIIEASFIFALVLLFVVVVISASIKMSDKSGTNGSSGNGSGGNNGYTDDDAAANADDGNQNQGGMGDDYYVEHDGEDGDENTDDYMNGGGNDGRRLRGRALLRGRIKLDHQVGEPSAQTWHSDAMQTGGDESGTGLLDRRVGRTYLW